MSQPTGDDEVAPLTDAGLDALLGEVQRRVGTIVDDRRRLRLLLEAVVAISADLSLDSVLGRIVDTARELAGARYAALGVVGTSPVRALSAFVHSGMTAEQVSEIGDLPHGRGLLGLLVDHPVPLRLHTIGDHPASYGLPERHPSMSSFLGVPVRIREKVFGNLYLTEKLDGEDFTDQDEAIVAGLAAAAGVAIENAGLYEEAARRERWLAAAADATSALTTAPDDPRVLREQVERARAIADADLAELEIDETLVHRACRTGVEADEADRLRAGEGSAEVQELPLSPTAGRLLLCWREPQQPGVGAAFDPELPRRFAQQVGLALQAGAAQANQERLAIFEERDRIGRDLHDLVIQRLFAVGLSLENTGRLATESDVTGRISAAVDDIDATIKDIRRSIFALSAPHGSTDLRQAVAEVVDRSASTLGFRPTVRFEGPVNSVVDEVTTPHLLAVLNEALSNAARHAQAHAVDIVLSVGEHVALTVSDDGQGISDDGPRSGLRNMQARAESLGGECEVRTGPGAGTSVRWRVPAP